jgi:hypothetical protein
LKQKEATNLLIQPLPVSDWDSVGLYEVKLEVSLTDYPTVKATLPFIVRVAYPCGNLKDSYPSLFWLEQGHSPSVSKLFVFVNGHE